MKQGELTLGDAVKFLDKEGRARFGKVVGVRGDSCFVKFRANAEPVFIKKESVERVASRHILRRLFGAKSK